MSGLRLPVQHFDSIRYFRYLVDFYGLISRHVLRCFAQLAVPFCFHNASTDEARKASAEADEYRVQKRSCPSSPRELLPPPKYASASSSCWTTSCRALGFEPILTLGSLWHGRAYARQSA